MCGLCTRFRKRKRLMHGTILTVSRQIGLGRISVKNMTVYATMQPGPVLAAASMGPEGMGSASGALEMMAKSEVKESICVCVSVS
jgi:hypothetical protein